MQYNIIFTGTNLTGSAVAQVKQGLAEIRQETQKTSAVTTQIPLAITPSSVIPTQTPQDYSVPQPIVADFSAIQPLASTAFAATANEIQNVGATASTQFNKVSEGLIQIQQEAGKTTMSFRQMGQSASDFTFTPTYAQPTDKQQNKISSGLMEPLNVVTQSDNQGNILNQQLMVNDAFQETDSDVAKASNALKTYGVDGEQAGNQVSVGIGRASTSLTTLDRASYRGFRTLMMGASMASMVLTSLVSRQMQEENSLEGITNAQENYASVVTEYGRGSKQAASALNQLEKAQKSYNNAATMSNLMTMSMGIQLVGLGASIIQFLPSIEKLITGQKTLALVTTIQNAMSGPAGWAMLAGGVAAAGIGTYAVTQMLNTPASPTNVNVTVKSQNDVLTEYLKRNGNNNIISAGG